MSIYEAIFNRYSVREYRMEKIEPERLEALKRYLKTVALLDEEKPVEFEIVDNIDKKQKVHGLWKTEAPYYLAVYCGDDRLSMRNAGYTAEQAVLYLTSKELGTCYLGATKAGEDKKDGLKRFLVIAFGKASAKPFRDSSMAHRNSLAALCAFKDEPGEQVKSILRAARLAPSSFNSQPWRFVVYSDRDNPLHLHEKSRPILRKRSEGLQGVQHGNHAVTYHAGSRGILDEHGDAGGGAVCEEGL